MFRHELWNKIKAVFNDEDTTTNCSEGFNNAIQLSIPHNANVFSVIKQFKAEDALMMVKLREGATTAPVSEGGSSGNSKATYRKHRKESLKALLQNYDNLTTEKYMGYLKDYYNHSLD